MISKNTYNKILDKYGQVGSWTIWTPPGATVKSNTNNMSWLDDELLLDKLDTGFVFVGFNWSSTHGDQSDGGRIAWANFHSGYSRQNDYKLRYALSGTRYWGSYITDLIKFHSEVDSGKVKSYLNKHPEIIAENIRDFKKEIGYLQKNPVLVALGDYTYDLLYKYLRSEYRITKIKHYSYTIGKEDYREEVLSILDMIK